MSSSSPVGPGPAPSLSLEGLPNELLQAVTAFLVPPPPATTRFALRSCGTWEFKAAGAQWAEWKAGHQDLQAFARTSRRIRAVAGPQLYRTVVVHSGACLVRLYRHLLEKPEARQHIRALACLINLVDADTINDARREWYRQVRAGFRDSGDFLRWHPLWPSPRPGAVPTAPIDGSVAIGIVSWIVGSSDLLADLLFAFPDLTTTGPGTTFADYLFRHLVKPSAAEPPYFPAKPTLSRLSSLRLYCNREGPGRDETFAQTLSTYVVSALPRLKKLHTLELCCDSPAVWAPMLESGPGTNHPGLNPDLLPPAYPPLPALRHVRLYGSRIREPELVALCAACPNLEALAAHFEDCCDDELDRPRLPGGRTLDDALLGLADSLRHLELVALSEGHYLTRGRERPRKPENHRLRCFPHLHRLHHLTVDYRGLFGTLGSFAYEDGEALRALLPASLRSFTLVCEWGSDKDFKQSYLADLDMMLDGIKLLCAPSPPTASSSPHPPSGPQELASIALAIHSWPERRRYRGKFRRHVDAARAACRRAGVAFRTFEPLPQYRDEDEADRRPPRPGDADVDVDGHGDGHDHGHVHDHGHGHGHDQDENGEHNEGDNDYDYDYDEDDSGDEYEEEEQEDDEYYFSGDDEADLEREARRPASFDEFLQRLGDVHGHDVDELYNAYVEDRWDEYLF